MMHRIAIVVLALLVCASPLSAAKKKSSSTPKKKSSSTQSSSRSSSVRPVTVYTLAGCDRCAALTSKLRRNGVRLSVSPAYERYFDLYPTVIYSNRTRDHGDRIFNGRVSYPRSLEVVETE
jgi:hypothetical protein